MKNTILTIAKILVIVVIVGWMVLFVVDYFRARERVKPLFCVAQNTKTKGDESYYECIGLGYKYFEYSGSNSESPGYGFSAVFIKNEFEKKMED